MSALVVSLPAPTGAPPAHIPPPVTAVGNYFPFVRLIRPDAPEYVEYQDWAAQRKGEVVDRADRFGHQIEEVLRKRLVADGRDILPERVVARGRWFQEVDAVEWLGTSAIRIYEVKTLLGHTPRPWIEKGLWQLHDAAEALRPHYYVERRLVLVGTPSPYRLPTPWPSGGWNTINEDRDRVIFITFEELFELAADASLPVPAKLPGVSGERVLWYNAALAAEEMDSPMALAFSRAIAERQAA